MESITPITQIERAAADAAQHHDNAATACPYPPHTEAARLFAEHFHAALAQRTARHAEEAAA